MVPRVAGPSPRLGRVLGPLGRRAEALGSSDTAAAPPPGANGNYRSGPSQKSQMRVGGTIENYDFYLPSSPPNRQHSPLLGPDGPPVPWAAPCRVLVYAGRLSVVYAGRLSGVRCSAD